MNPSDFLYVILTPPKKHSSAGIMALWKLYDTMAEQGYNVMALTYGFDGLLTLGGRSGDSRDFDIDHIIAIYPDTVLGNPINAKHVVNYQLNRFGVLGGSMPEQGNYILNHSKAFGEGNMVLFNPFSLKEAIEYSYSNHRMTEGNINVYYQGKGQRHEFESCLEITRDWPAQRDQLFYLLDRTDVFYCSDPLTSLTVEAKLLGATISPLGWSLKTGEYEIDYSMSADEIVHEYDHYAHGYYRKISEFAEGAAKFFGDKLNANSTVA